MDQSARPYIAEMQQFLMRHVKIETSQGQDTIRFCSGMYARVVNSPDQHEFTRLSTECVKGGVRKQVLPFDGHEHSYKELSEWLGDEPSAFRFIALAVHFGQAELLTPKSILGASMERFVSQDLEMQLFHQGMCSIVKAPSRNPQNKDAPTMTNGSVGGGPTG